MEKQNEIEYHKVKDSVSKEYNLPIQLISNDAITNTYYNYEKIESIAKWLENKVNLKPTIAIICGSGLGEIANLVQEKTIIPYTDIPEFPRSTVHGHHGNLVFGHLSDLPVVCMQGRFHPFEGYSLALCAMPIKIFKLLGVKILIITNAAGGINQTYDVGELMLIKDHISFPILSLQHPLIGPNDERFGPRFLPINALYDRSLRNLFKESAKELNINIQEGVYGSVGGPTYESPTDSRWCKIAGMDAVGMSTTHEAVVGVYCGMRVVGLSIITDKVSLEYDDENYQDHEEIVKVANLKSKDAVKLISYFVKTLNQNKIL